MTIQDWAAGPLVGLDFETTGVDVATARVVQAALLLVEPDGKLAEESTCFVVNPGVEIPAAAAAIHGITTEHARLHGCTTRTMVETLLARMEDFGVAAGRAPLVIFNGAYDWPLLRAEAARCQMPVEFRPMILDPRIIDLAGDKYRKGSRKLADVATCYGVELVGAHGAHGDALAAVGIVRAMLERWPKLGAMTLERLQELQAGWFVDWRDHINEYWASKGKEDRVTGTWPDGNSAVVQQAGAS